MERNRFAAVIGEDLVPHISRHSTRDGTDFLHDSSLKMFASNCADIPHGHNIAGAGAAGTSFVTLSIQPTPH
eukprot:1464719-Amphidinium_carterae.1